MPSPAPQARSPISQLTADFERVRLSHDSPSPKKGLSRWLQKLKEGHARSRSADAPRDKTLPPLPPPRPGTPLASSSHRPVMSTSVPNLVSSTDRKASPYTGPSERSPRTPAQLHANGGPRHALAPVMDSRQPLGARSTPALASGPQTPSYNVVPPPPQDHSMTYQYASASLHTPDSYTHAATPPRPQHARNSLDAPVPVPSNPVYPFSSSQSFPAFPSPHTPSPHARPPAPVEPLYISMPIPSRQTLLYATPDARPHCTSAPPETAPPAQPPLLPSPGIYASPPRSTPKSKPNPPVTPARRPRVTSSPASPTTPASPPTTTVQCAGITKAQTRCTRQVKAVAPLAYLAPDVPLERYCFQHARDMMQPTGFYTHQEVSVWVEFADYIPPYLSTATQILLRSIMESPPSIVDEPGYIYAYELRTPSQSSEPVQLKVGRTVNLVKRLGEWKKQCGKEVVLRGFWPPAAEEGEGEGGEGGAKSLMQGKVKGGERAEFSHRLERLIHIELADISLYSTHLTPAFTNPALLPPTGPAPASPASPRALPPKRRPLLPCDDCGRLHQEIFTFERVREGRLRGKEWEGVVWGVVQKWGRFVRECM